MRRIHDSSGESPAAASGKEQVENPDEPKTTTSVDNLQAGPQLYDPGSYKAGPVGCLWAHASRLNMLQIHKVLLLPDEKRMMDRTGLGSRSSQYLAWRRSLLHSGAFFFAGIVVFDVLVLLYTLSGRGAEAQFLEQLDDRYNQHFEKLLWFVRLNTIGLLASSAVSVVLAVVASLTWQTLARSAPAVRGSFLCSYLPPFLLLLLIPFRSGVNFEGIQRQVCDDIVSGAVNTTGSAQAVAQWPAPGDGSFARLLKERGEIRLPSDFCNGDPRRWGTVVTESINASGLLRDTGGSCPQVDIGGADGECPEACSNCTGICRPHLLPLTMVASAIGESLDDVDGALGGLWSQCFHCVQRSQGLQCLQRCPAVSRQLLQQSMQKRGIPDPNNICVDPGKLNDFELLVRLGMQRSYWEALLGSLFAVLSLAQLMPLALSLLMGAAKGSGIAKSVVPYSRLPYIVSACAAVFTFPFALQLAIIVQTTIGDWLTLVGVLLLLAAIVLSMKPDKMQATSHSQLESRQFILSSISKLCIVASLIIFAAAAYRSDLSKTAFEFRVRCDKGLCMTGDRLELARDQVLWNLFRALFTFLGKSMVSTVFFADSVVSLMHLFYDKESNDPINVQCARAVLVQDIHGMFGKKVSQGVQPDIEHQHGELRRETQHEDAMDGAHAVIPLSALVMVHRMLANAGNKSDVAAAASDGDDVDARADYRSLAANVARIVESTEASVREMREMILLQVDARRGAGEAGRADAVPCSERLATMLRLAWNSLRTARSRTVDSE